MIKVEIKGLRELQAKMEKAPANLLTEVSGILERGCQTFVRNAKRDAPVDFGVLKNSISYAKLQPLSFELISGARYSAYLEWGTITRVSVPAELVAYALTFKGKGIRKNGGIYPQPFFFKHVIPMRLQIEKDVEVILKDII